MSSKKQLKSCRIFLSFWITYLPHFKLFYINSPLEPAVSNAGVAEWLKARDLSSSSSPTGRTRT